MEAPERVEIEAEHIQDRFSRTVAIAIVVVTLLIAMAHFLESYNEEKSAEAAINAQKLAILSNGQQAALLQDAGANFQLFAQAEEQRTREANGLQTELNEIANNAINDKETTRLTQERQRWSQLASITEGMSDLKSGSTEGPQQDAAFPSTYLNDKLVELDRLRAERDAANEDGQEWDNKVTAYAAVLTLTAVSLYLLGLSIALKVRVRRGLAALGAGLAVTAIVSSVAVQATAPHEAPPAAADEYAQGLKLVHNGLAHSDIGMLKDGATRLRKATELRPKFALAYEQLGEAEIVAGAPTPSAIGVVASDDALHRGEAALKKAQDLGDRGRTVLVDYGAVQYDLWLRDGRSSRLDDAIKLERQAQALDDADPIPSANMALGLLAQGREGDARSAFRDSMVRALKLHNERLTEAHVADTLTTLETLVKAKPDSAGKVQAIKEYLTSAGAASSPDPPRGDARTVNDVQINANAGSLDWSAVIPDLRQRSDQVSVQWYYRDPAKTAWAALPAPSGSYSELPVVTFRGANGYGQRNAFLAPTGECLHDGSYRVEVYVNGRLGSSAEKDFTLGAFTGHRMLDVGAAACVPDAWKTTPNGVRGFENGYAAPSNDAGVLFFRYQDAGVGGSADAHAVSAKYLALTMEAFKDQFPSPPAFSQRSNYQFFMSLEGAEVQFFSYPGGRVQVGAGQRKDDGSVLVGLVYAPESAFTSTGPATQVFNSFVEPF